MLTKLLKQLYDFFMHYGKHLISAFTSSQGSRIPRLSSSSSSAIRLPRLSSASTKKSLSWFSSLTSHLPSALAVKLNMAQQPTVQPQNFDYFLVLDFEATCDSPKRLVPMEIIEFPVLKVSASTFEVEDIFHRYVRPTINPELTPFCTELTGILQEMVDQSDKFHKVHLEFQQWLADQKLIDEQFKKPLQRFTFVTCGDWDLKKIYPMQCHLVGHDVPKHMCQWINVKKSFVDQLKEWPRSQATMIEHFGIEARGRAHSGIDDCHNLALILHEIAKLGHVFENTSSFKGLDM